MSIFINRMDEPADVGKTINDLKRELTAVATRLDERPQPQHLWCLSVGGATEQINDDDDYLEWYTPTWYPIGPQRVFRITSSVLDDEGNAKRGEWTMEINGTWFSWSQAAGAGPPEKVATATLDGLVVTQSTGLRFTGFSYDIGTVYTVYAQVWMEGQFGGGHLPAAFNLVETSEA